MILHNVQRIGNPEKYKGYVPCFGILDVRNGFFLKSVMLQKDQIKSAARLILDSGDKECLAAIYLAETLFADHVDLANKPYIGHLQRVARDVEDDLKPAAYLHDLIEDIEGWTYDDLSEIGFRPITVDCVRAVTKFPGELFYRAIERLAKTPAAIAVKRADLRDNCNLLRWDHRPGEKEIGRVMKYFYAEKYLAAIAEGTIPPGTAFNVWMLSLPEDMRDKELLAENYG